MRWLKVLCIDLYYYKYLCAIKVFHVKKETTHVK